MKKHFRLDSANQSSEFKLMLSIINNRTGCMSKDDSFDSDFNWILFLQLVRHHRLSPIIYTRLSKKSDVRVPQKVMNALYHDHFKNLLWMLQLCREIGTLSDLFKEHSIQSLHLKGPVLALDLFEDFGQRTSSDLDILVPMHQLDKADEILLKQGYKKEEYIQSILSDWKWRHHHNTYFHPINKVKVELHWRLHPGPAKEPSFNILWQRKRLITIGGKIVEFLGKEDLLLFLIIHGARHGWSRLRWLLDIHQILKKDISTNVFLNLVKQYQAYGVSGQALILSKKLFCTNPREEFLCLLNSEKSEHLANLAQFYVNRMINLHTEPVPFEVAVYHKRYLFSVMSLRQKSLFLLSFFYPYPKDAETLPLPKALHFLYFPLRPVLLIWRKTRKHVLP